MKRISPARAARLLDVPERTVRWWCEQRAEGRASRLLDVERLPNGYYRIDAGEIRRLKSTGVR